VYYQLDIWRDSRSLSTTLSLLAIMNILNDSLQEPLAVMYENKDSFWHKLFVIFQCILDSAID
jgi:hypothetical protein